MTRVITVANQKGGVGKTTTAVNVAFFLGLAGRKTLLIDLDPQANATSSLGVSFPGLSPFHVKLAGGFTETAIIESGEPNLWVVPARPGHDFSPSLTATTADFIQHVRELLAPYDFVIIDSPPSVGAITKFSLQLADSVLIPIQCEYLAMEGLSQMLPLIARLSAARETPLQIERLVFTMFDENSQHCASVVEEVTSHFPSDASENIVPRDMSLAEAASHSLPVFRYDPRSRASWAYLTLTKEILNGRQEAR
ncbi:MAG: ParA family protein [Planctomycetota bacterium]